VILTATLTAGNLVTLEDWEAGPPDDIVVQEGTAGATLTGGDLDPVVTLSTPVAALNGGGGVDPSGIVITNATRQVTYEARLTFAGVESLGDIIEAINTSGTYVRARINVDGWGIDVYSSLNGARLSIQENGGSSAQQLGILLPLERVKLRDLNNGRGVSTVYGEDFRITTRDGTTIDVDISNCRTVQDVIDAINDDPENPGTLVAQVDPVTGDRLQIIDSGPDTGVNLQVQMLNGSYAARNLGIEGSVPNPGDTLTGTALSPLGVQSDSIFTALVNLRDALWENDGVAIGNCQQLLREGMDGVLDARAESGARMSRLEMAQRRLEEEKVQMQRLLSGVVDADLAEVATRFQQQQIVLQAGLAAAARILQLSLFNFLA
jgi:flagellin-like hook-associated protein FlgL